MVSALEASVRVLLRPALVPRFRHELVQGPLRSIARLHRQSPSRWLRGGRKMRRDSVINGLAMILALSSPPSRTAHFVAARTYTLATESVLRKWLSCSEGVSEIV
jgi:hypothetical protein